LVGVIQLLLLRQPTIWDLHRPVLASIGAAIYPVGVAVILGLMVGQRRLLRRSTLKQLQSVG
ncbi:MAG: hypothetical protein ACXVGN_12210, partial [Mycobacteriaceae bacterium]